jgi:hypothetical protein
VGICGAREEIPWGTDMRILLSTSRRQIRVLLATGLVAATAAVAGPAVAAHAEQDCTGSSCNGLNSNTAGCVSDAVSRSAPQTFSDTAAGEQLAIQLRGSPSCESRWARVWAFNSSGSQWLPPSGLKFTIYSDNASGHVVYSQTATVGSRGWESNPYWVGPMVSGVGLYSKACFPNGVCTSWWPSAPPDSCDAPPVFFGLHGMGEGPSSTIRAISPELLSFDTDQNAISGAVAIVPVSYPTVYPSKWRSLLTTASALKQGEEALQHAIMSYSEGCSPARDKIALVGYSMGAWVINDWIMSHPGEWDMIRAVVLYGDPCYTGGFFDKGLARLFAYGAGCMPSSDYPYPAARAHVPFQVKTYSLPHDPVSGENWHGAFTDVNKASQLAAAIGCTNSATCSHLDYTGNTEIYEGALFVVNRLVG